MADVFSGITSDFDEMIRGLGDELISGFKRGVRSAKAGTTVDAPLTMQNHDAQQGELLLRNYVESLAEYHKRSIEPSAIEALTHGVSTRIGHVPGPCYLDGVGCGTGPQISLGAI